MTQLRINPAIDPERFARIYAETKCVRVPDIFEPTVIDALELAVQSLPWRLIVQDDQDQNVLLTSEELAAMSPEARAKLADSIRDRAARNIGYTYHTYPMIQARLQGWDQGHPIHAMTDFLNSPPFFEFARILIGCPGLTKTDAHATRYGPGHYLTRHIDDGEIKERRAAYTIGLSRMWEPDWGGLLLFLDDKLDVINGFKPCFNALTVFDGLKLHTVTAISGFAPVPRLSVTGWFRDDPPYAAQQRD